MLHIFTDGVDSVIAESVVDAGKVWEEVVGEKRDDCGDDVENWDQLPDDVEIELWYFEHERECTRVPPTAEMSDNKERGEFYAKDAAANWIAFLGRGWFSSTEF